ncbi:NAD(P)-dependent alcohol dehydrogenase [Herbiconiux sp. CPCC 203407]|uniref:NAD(P)-dependent alcohol dehydrogenase n=1 Tax=Herbiconiux oxytropis TaxID=2970915 RepID=A0AA41XIL2_9MICO|nr:NAD(P)-dependent alcohol dehydrogenase [Herbiconiux oxytropis]MCS5722282.1 NAD(P)-dependent alcohol dehydrogenase [Herbiconiux oxytropis]MCS5727080.1 NAD(P)-dependent alcohol dehydrogenase [Herbiconiux oxytropis]
MRAAVNTEYGDPEVVRVSDIERPVPGQGEVLVRVHAAAVTAADSRLRAPRFPRGFGPMGRLALGLRRPRRPVLGNCVSGVVEAIGGENAGAGGGRLRVGQEVAGMTGARMGGHAEFALAKASRLVPKPAGVSHDQAAGVLFGGTTALHYLREKGRLAPGSSVLVVGASGAVGTNAVQLAVHLGARVTAVTSGANVELVEQLGASSIVDHSAPGTPAACGGRGHVPYGLAERFDLVLDTVGVLSPTTGRRLLTGRGVLLLAVADLGQTLRSVGRVKSGPAPERPGVFAELLDLVDRGLIEVVVESVHPLDDIVTAHHRVDSGRKVGNILVHP